MVDSSQTDSGELSIAQQLAAISAEQDAIVDRIAELERTADGLEHYPLERVRDGVGRWIIPRHNTLEAHYALIKDKERDIDFSPANYEAFDAVFTEKYAGVGFFDPMHNNFPKFGPLRDNLATVRNYMLQLYFPDHSTDDALRIGHLKEIASYLAEGLTNDRAFLGLVPVHNPFKPFIDVERASAPDGEGARYLYQKILEMQRNSNWTRPFSAITALFGGSVAGKWDLPSANHSAFAYNAADCETVQEDIGEAVAALAVQYDVLEAKRQQLVARQQLSTSAVDLDGIGNQLLFSFYQMRDAVEDLSSPIKREAIDIAHEILRKLSVKLGAGSVHNGMDFKPDDENAALGSSSGVGRMLVRMAGMMRGLGEDIMANPAIAGAHQALGQLAYLAKLEALHMANAAGDTKLAGSLRGQLSQLRQFAHGIEGKSFGDILDSLKEGVSALEQKLRAAGLVVEGQQIDTNLAGKGSGSQMQAMTAVRQQQSAQQQTAQTKQQQGLNQAQQMQASQANAQTQAALTQMQAAQRAQQPLNGRDSLFSQPTVTVKRAPNGAAAMKNAAAARKTIQAEINKAMVTAPVQQQPQANAAKAPAPNLAIDPRLLAGIGNTLNSAQTSAATLSTAAIGPRTGADAIKRAQAEKALADKTAKQAAQDASVEQYEQHLAHTRPPTGGRTR